MKQMFDAEMRNDRLGLGKYGDEKKKTLNLIMICGAVALIVSVTAFVFGSIVELKDLPRTASLTTEE